MTKSFTNLLGIIITIVAGIYFYLNYCSSCGATVNDVPAAVVAAAPDPTSYPFAFSNGAFAFKVNENYNFNLSSSDILKPLSPKVGRGIQGLRVFLAENPDKSFNITGYYTNGENNNTAFPNLGLARANAVKNHLVSQGISSTQINTMGKQMDLMVPDGNVYRGPIVYAIEGENDTQKEDLNALYDQIKTDPLILYFEKSKSSIELSPEQRQQFANISKYLDKDANASCTITGYTDNTSSRTTNLVLGQRRAEFAKAYLVKNGISEARLKTSSKGPDDPVASNGTEEGRSKNRRTVVTLN
ncbi:OmpA family protein [Flavobacteriaceae bacterium F89]|uniref:OmpA family protein n=1 Tax=Cerina litoralis TaxID=2874477 RepID=A0AAE3ETF4_9FLAO|nr:OmpA family protein [Cerina litoralis]MCG2459401.1 OmpA family protein [Cerina litoralis]